MMNVKVNDGTIGEKPCKTVEAMDGKRAWKTMGAMGQSSECLARNSQGGDNMVDESDQTMGAKGPTSSTTMSMP